MGTIFRIVIVFASLGAIAPPAFAAKPPCLPDLSPVEFALNHALEKQKIASQLALSNWSTMVNEVAAEPYTATELERGRTEFEKLHADMKIDESTLQQLAGLTEREKYILRVRSAVELVKFTASPERQLSLAKHLVSTFWLNPFRPRDFRKDQEKIIPAKAKK